MCYFEDDAGAVPMGSGDLTEGDWDELDAIHDAVLADPQSRDSASRLGQRIRQLGMNAAQGDKELGRQRRNEMCLRYADVRPRVTRKIVLLRTDSAEVAVGKLRQLGDDFVSALKNALM